MAEPVLSEELLLLGFSCNTIIFICCFFLCAYFMLRRDPRIHHHLDLLGGPPALPVVGNVLEFLRPHHEYIPMLADWTEKYGQVFRAWIGNFIAYVFISDPNEIEKILSTHLNKGKYEYNLLHDWLGTGLLTADREKWSKRRKMLTPSFHFKILGDFIPIFNEQASIFVKCLEKEAVPGRSFDMYPYIASCTLDVICETAMGKRINAQTSDENKAYIDAVNGMCSLLLKKLTEPWIRIPFIYYFTPLYKLEKEYLRTLKGFSEKVIQGRKAERLAKSLGPVTVDENDKESDSLLGNGYGKHKKAFLDLLLDVSEQGENLTDDDIREEVDTFMFEGYDTTGVSLGWTILLLASYPDIQRRVHEELDKLFADDPSRNITLDDISKMKFLECCVKESLRLYPSVPFIMRQIESDIKLESGKIIPQGATAFIAIYFSHRNSSQFPKPYDFNPDRFSGEDTVKRHPYALLFFSASSRNCIGQKFALLEEKIILAKLFRMYRIEAVKHVKNVKSVPNIVLRCYDGINVRLYKR